MSDGKLTDGTSKVTNADDKVVVEFKKAEIADLPWTSHIFMFEFEGVSGSTVLINKTFEVKTTIVEEIGVSVS